MQPILVADDSPDDIFLFQHAAEVANIRLPLRFVSDGDEVVQYLQGTGRFADRGSFPLPRLLFLDNKMTFRNGLETLLWLRHRAPLPLRNLITILLSSSQEDCDVDAAYRLGANGYLVKPADNDTLSRMISCVCDFWCRYNQTPSAPPRPMPTLAGFPGVLAGALSGLSSPRMSSGSSRGSH